MCIIGFKEHSQLLEHADMDTGFLIVKRVDLNWNQWHVEFIDLEIPFNLLVLFPV